MSTVWTRGSRITWPISVNSRLGVSRARFWRHTRLFSCCSPVVPLGAMMPATASMIVVPKNVSTSQTASTAKNAVPEFRKSTEQSIARASQNPT